MLFFEGFFWTRCKWCRNKFFRGIRLPVHVGGAKFSQLNRKKACFEASEFWHESLWGVCHGPSRVSAQCCISLQKWDLCWYWTKQKNTGDVLGARGSKLDVMCMVSGSELTATAMYLCHFNMLSKVTSQGWKPSCSLRTSEELCKAQIWLNRPLKWQQGDQLNPRTAS